MKKKYTILTILISLFSFVLISGASLLTYAYFSTITKVYTPNGTQNAELGMELSLLFDKIDSTKVEKDTTLGVIQYHKEQNMSTLETTVTEVYATYDPDATWGSEKNPYIISDIRHLQNLSALQDVGYFQDYYINENYTNNAYNNGTNVPNFLICKNDGTPVTINGTGVTILPIGNDTYPFIGRIGGAFKTNTTTIVSVNSSPESVIYNLTVQTNSDLIDVGLFGNVSYMGDETNLQDGVFTGFSSVIRGFVLYDVSVVVNNPTIVDRISQAIFNQHIWSYSDLDDTNKNNVAHENHHIGIVVGHASYATIEYISVYYSDSNVNAIDLSHTTAQDSSIYGDTPNYYSTCGFIGYMYNLNPNSLDGKITAGSGTSSDNISQEGSAGTGGGLLSGTGRGYVSAALVYEKYKYNSNGTAATSGADVLIREAYDSEGNALAQRSYGTLLGQQIATDNYYFYDGVFTFALSGDGDKMSTTWSNDTPDTFTTGTNDSSKWKKNTTKGNNSVVAFVKNITNATELNNAIDSKKQIYIGYENSGTTSLMTLATDSSGSGINTNDYYSAGSISKTFITNADEVSSMQETLQSVYASGVEPIEGLLPRTSSNTVNTDVINNIGDYRILNLGSGSDLNTIKQEYPVKATKNGSYYRLQSAKTNSYLALAVINGWLTGYKYSIYINSSKPSYSYGSSYWVQDATISFNSDGTCKVYYTYTSQSETRYIYYSNEEFKGTSDSSTSTAKLRLYTVEGTSNMNFGRVTYDPTENSQTYNANEVILWPETVYTTGNSRDTSATPYASYSLKKLEASTDDRITGDDILTGASGWKNSNGATLTLDDLKKEFQMSSAVNFSLTFSLGNIINASTGSVIAPVGSAGVKANIPQGSVAFRINKAGTSKIRVILSVPTSELYATEDGYELSENSIYYLGLWQMSANGQQILSRFSIDNAQQKFELPKSRPYDPSSNAAESDYILVKNPGTDTYSRCYLNGQKVLVGYEFTVNVTADNSIFILATTAGPMHIAYFSADGTASAGKDGTGGSRLGSIDFVYTNSEGEIKVVSDAISSTENNYENYYYSSLVLMYTDNSNTEISGAFVPINEAQIKVRRVLEGGNLYIYYSVDGNEHSYIVIKGYNAESDTVTNTGS